MNRKIVAAVLAIVALGTAVSVYFEVSTRPSCDLAPNGSTIYVIITHDGMAAANATVDAGSVERCNGVDTTVGPLYQPPVNASGIAKFDASYDTFLSVTVHYGGHDFPFNVNVQGLATCARLSVPSGSLSILAC